MPPKLLKTDDTTNPRPHARVPMPVPKADAKHSTNPVVRIVAHNTSPKQPDAMRASKVKLTARHGSVDVDAVEDLLEDAVADGELEEVAEDVYAVSS